MFSAWIVAGCLVLAQAPETPADLERAQANKVLESKVKKQLRLIQDSDAIADREAAVKQLIEMGPSILPFLVLPKTADDPDLLIRVEQVRVTLEKQQAKQFAEARQVTLAANEQPVSQVLAQLEKQGETKLLDYRERFGEEAADPKITVDLKGVPFWKALDQVLDAARLTRYPNPESAGIAYHNLPEGILPAFGKADYPGPFRVEAAEMQVMRNLRRKGAAGVLLNVEVAWEPRLRPIAMFQNLSDIKMLDENGDPLKFEQSDATQELSLSPGDTSATLSLSLEAPPRNIKKIGTLKGKIEALVPSKVEKFEFPSLQAKTPIVKKQGGATVSIDQIRKNNEVWEIRVIVRFEKASGALESHRDWALDNPCLLITPKKTLEHDAMELFRRDDDSIGVAYLFDVEDLKNCSLTYETPVLIMKLPIEYELKDIELP